MKKAWITVGVSASGKSTWADAFISDLMKKGVDVWNVNRDDIRRRILVEKQLQPITEMGVRWQKWKWKWEAQVNAVAEENLSRIISYGWSVVISDTNLKAKYRNPLIKRLEDAGYEVEIVEFPISFKDACDRDAARLNGVGVSVIAKQMEEWVEFQAESGKFRKFVPNTSLGTAVICDIDGTLAHMVDRGPFDWDRVGTDVLDTSVAAVLDVMVKDSFIILLSGRDGVCEKETVEWLERNNVSYDMLYMRKPGDMRPDAIIKSEIFWDKVADKFNPFMVIDDRPVMCRMWRDMGLKVFQVGTPHIEF